jgi:ABC-type antimicrobial peptide transport system permease subunit
MRFIDYITMALRNIRRQKLRSALTIFAVVIGATSVTIMLAAVFSLKGFMTRQFEANGVFQQVAVSPQADITWDSRGSGGNCTDCVKLTDDLVSKIAVRPHITAVARQTNMWQFEAMSYGNQKLRMQQMVAYDANGVVTSNIVAGRDLLPTDKESVVTITSDYADKLGFKQKYPELIGKEVVFSSNPYYSGVGADPLQQAADQQAWFKAHPNADGRDYQPAPVLVKATIVGIASSDIERFTVRVPLDWARGMQLNRRYETTKADQDAAQAACRSTLNHGGPCNVQAKPSLTVSDELAKNGYTSLLVKVDRASNAADVAKDIENTFKVGAADAQTQIKQQLAIFNILGLVLGGIGGIALVVAAVGVVNTMVMSILERTREIGVMRAVGARRATVSRLFTFEAGLLGFFGGVVGLLLGYGAILAANPFINDQLQTNHIKSTNIIALPLWLIIGVVALTTVIGILAGLYPARRAAKLDPVEALRYE